MEEKDFEARLTKLSHDIEQLDAKIDDKISSLREELRRWILTAYFLEVRDVSNTYLDIGAAFNPNVSEVCKRARTEVEEVAKEYLDLVDKVSADEFQKNLGKFKKDINRITRSAGLTDFWDIEK
jgi:Skp family chaperone for outer membrane proteins